MFFGKLSGFDVAQFSEGRRLRGGWKPPLRNGRLYANSLHSQNRCTTLAVSNQLPENAFASHDENEHECPLPSSNPALFRRLFLTGCRRRSDERHPNVIFVMPDDISHYSFSYYKPDGPRTPHIDGLAADSVRLTDFHVSPTCSPTRASLMTGRFNAAAGVWHTIYQRNQLRADEITMAEVFKHNGGLD